MTNQYIALRNQYLPKRISVIFILESPPEGHGYFYDASGRVSEVLFRAFMKLLGAKPDTKEEGLLLLQEKGWVLVNPIYIPVNKLSEKEADRMILDNYAVFVADLKNILADRFSEVPIVLVKSNIVRILEKPLLNDGFRVINDGIMVPFPLHYHADSFQEKVLKLLSRVAFIK
jgi:hypothetical protein